MLRNRDRADESDAGESAGLGTERRSASGADSKNVEASRSDDAGDGFAVVAEEVKSLAEESQESADNTASVVENAQRRTADLVGSIHDANDRVDDGADEVEDLADRLETID